MTTRFLQTAFTDSVKGAQRANGSRHGYSRHDDAPTERDRLSETERNFIASRDSFYLATTMETGWPYIQHRGGAAGFVKVVDERTLGFADFRGNRQYITVGNAAQNDRAALFFMDYPSRTRLKILGRLRIVDPKRAPELQPLLSDSTYKAIVERFVLIDIEAFDWNCPQHITPRYTLEEMSPVVIALRQQIAALERQLAEATLGV
jgi:predicted pyridoxine 5'-phosphate oxidase superfamily flavin-nucleotide-binding protein